MGCIFDTGFLLAGLGIKLQFHSLSPISKAVSVPQGPVKVRIVWVFKSYSIETVLIWPGITFVG